MTALTLERIVEIAAPAFAPPLRGAALGIVPNDAPAALLGATEPASIPALEPRPGTLARIGIGARVAAVHLVIVALWVLGSQTRLPEPLPEGIAVALIVETPPPAAAAVAAAAPAPEAPAAEAPADPAPEPPPLVAASSQAEPPAATPDPMLPEAVVPEPAAAELVPPVEPVMPPRILAEAAPAEPAPEPVIEPAPAPPLADVLPRPKPPPPARREPAPIAVAAVSSPADATTAGPAQPHAAAAAEQVAVAVPAAPPALPLVAPRPVSGVAGNPKPDYPVEARRRRLQGDVVLRVAVSPAGASDAVTILVSSGHPLLDDAALAAVRGWRFNPATRGGAAVAAPVDVPIRFRLQD